MEGGVGAEIDHFSGGRAQISKCPKPGVLRATRIADCLIVSRVFPSTPGFQDASPGSMSRRMLLAARPLISKSSFWIGSDNVWFALVLDLMIQWCGQHDLTCHVAQSIFNVHDSVDGHGGSTTSSIHHDGSQHVQIQHLMSPLKLINLKTCAKFMKISSSHWT